MPLSKKKYCRLYGVQINVLQMFRTLKSKSGLYLPVIICFILKKGGKLGSCNKNAYA